jgi:hypothetical protein
MERWGAVWTQKMGKSPPIRKSWKLWPGTPYVLVDVYFTFGGKKREKSVAYLPSMADVSVLSVVEAQVCYTGLLKMSVGVLTTCSPDATPCDFFLWGYVKDRVYVPPLPASIPELKVQIRTNSLERTRLSC